MKDLIVHINGEVWKIKVIEDKPYIKKFGADSEAITDTKSRIITFNKSHISSFDTIIHELNHAFFMYLFLSSTTSIIMDDFEEIVSEYIGYNLSRIFITGLYIFNHFNKVKSGRKTVKQLLNKTFQEPNNTNFINLMNKVIIDNTSIKG